MSEPFDEESFAQLPPETQGAVGHIINGLKTANWGVLNATGEASRAAHLEFDDYLGKTGTAIKGLALGEALINGDNEAAVEQASEWLAGELLSKGFGDIVEKTISGSTRIPLEYQTANDAFTKKWSKSVGGILADGAIEAGKAIKDAVEREQYNRYSSHQKAVIHEYSDIKDVIDNASLNEYSHFEELASNNIASKQGELGPWDERPYDTNFHNDIEAAIHTSTVSIANNPIADESRFGISLFGVSNHGVDQLSDVVRLNGNNRAIEFSLDEMERLDTDDRLMIEGRSKINLAADVEGYVSRHAVHAHNDGRDIDFRQLDENARGIIREADYLQVELGKKPDRESESEINPEFFNGTLDASNNDGGTVQIGRDGGKHTGSDFADLSIDGSHVEAGGGDDIIVLDANSGRGDDPLHVATHGPTSRAFGGEGRDQLTGGLHADQLHGGQGEDILNGDRGNDVLYGTGLDHDDSRARGQDAADDGVRDILTGGEGKDIYFAGDKDIIQTTAGEDKTDVINFGGITLQGPDGKTYPDGHIRGVNGEIYSLSEDGSELIVTYDDKELTIRDYQEGDFGIDFSKETASVTPSLLRDGVLETPFEQRYALGQIQDASQESTFSKPTDSTSDFVPYEQAVQQFSDDREILRASDPEATLPITQAANHSEAEATFVRLNDAGIERFPAAALEGDNAQERVGNILVQAQEIDQDLQAERARDQSGAHNEQVKSYQAEDEYAYGY